MALARQVAHLPAVVACLVARRAVNLPVVPRTASVALDRRIVVPLRATIAVVALPTHRLQVTLLAANIAGLMSCRAVRLHVRPAAAAVALTVIPDIRYHAVAIVPGLTDVPDVSGGGGSPHVALGLDMAHLAAQIARLVARRAVGLHVIVRATAVALLERRSDNSTIVRILVALHPKMTGLTTLPTGVVLIRAVELDMVERSACVAGGRLAALRVQMTRQTAVVADFVCVGAVGLYVAVLAAAHARAALAVVLVIVSHTHALAVR